MHSYYWFIARSLRDEIVELVFFLILSGPVLFNISFLLFFFSLSFSRTNFLVRSVSISFYFFSFSPRLAFLSIFLTDRSRKKWEGKKMNREMGEIKRKNAKKESVLFFTSLSIIYNIPCKEINFYEYRLRSEYIRLERLERRVVPSFLVPLVVAVPPIETSVISGNTRIR